MLSQVACNSSTDREVEKGSEDVIDKATVSWSSTEIDVTPSKAEITYLPGETIPIMSCGSIAGYIKVNWVQKLGINDYLNSKAVLRGINSSYTINMNVDFSENIDRGEMLIVSIKPYLISSSGNLIGNPCIVGWSGFSSEAQLYDNDDDTNIEIGVQPEVEDLNDAIIKLQITDSNGNKYDDVYLSNDYIADASEGSHLVTDSYKTVHSINGAAFSIGVSNVYCESHYYEDGTESLFYDFSQDLTYDNAPINDREVLLFDSNDSNSLSGKMLCYVTSDTDGTKLYNADSSVFRLKYYDSDKMELYATGSYVQVPVGMTASSVENRKIPSKHSSATYVRIHYEFPAEADARTLEEMKDFDGRFLVFQEHIDERELTSYYDSDEYKKSRGYSTEE